MKEHFLNSKLGLPYEYKYYDFNSFHEIKDELNDEEQVHLVEHEIFFPKSTQNKVFTFDDGRVVVDTGGSGFVFESESYSIWLYDGGLIDRVVSKTSKCKIKGAGTTEVDAHLISDFLTEIILEFAEIDNNESLPHLIVNKTPNGWVIIQSLSQYKNYLILQDEPVDYESLN